MVAFLWKPHSKVTYPSICEVNQNEEGAARGLLRRNAVTGTWQGQECVWNWGPPRMEAPLDRQWFPQFNKQVQQQDTGTTCPKVARAEWPGPGRGKTVSTGKRASGCHHPSPGYSPGGEEGLSVRMSDTSRIFQLSKGVRWGSGWQEWDTQKWKMLSTMLSKYLCVNTCILPFPQIPCKAELALNCDGLQRNITFPMNRELSWHSKDEKKNEAPRATWPLPNLYKVLYRRQKMAGQVGIPSYE